MFGYCPFQSDTGMTGSMFIEIGTARTGDRGEGCIHLEGLRVDWITLVLNIEYPSDDPMN